MRCFMFGELVDRVGIYGSKEAEGFSAFNVGLVPVILLAILVDFVCFEYSIRESLITTIFYFMIW